MSCCRCIALQALRKRWYGTGVVLYSPEKVWPSCYTSVGKPAHSGGGKPWDKMLQEDNS